MVCTILVIYGEAPFALSLEFWYMGSRACLCEQPSVKTLDSEFVTDFPEQKHWTCCSFFLFLEKEATWCGPSQKEENIRSLCTDFSRLCLSFSLADPVIYHFTIINLSHEYNYILSVVNPFSKSLEVWVVLRNPETIPEVESKMIF